MQYYSEEHLSAMEKHKLELQKVREEFRIHEGDCGSSQVQSKLHHLLIVCEPSFEFFSSLKEGLRRNVNTEDILCKWGAAMLWWLAAMDNIQEVLLCRQSGYICLECLWCKLVVGQLASWLGAIWNVEIKEWGQRRNIVFSELALDSDQKRMGLKTRSTDQFSSGNETLMRNCPSTGFIIVQRGRRGNKFWYTFNSISSIPGMQLLCWQLKSSTWLNTWRLTRRYLFSLKPKPGHYATLIWCSILAQSDQNEICISALIFSLFICLLLWSRTYIHEGALKGWLNSERSCCNICGEKTGMNTVSSFPNSDSGTSHPKHGEIQHYGAELLPWIFLISQD